MQLSFLGLDYGCVYAFLMLVFVCVVCVCIAECVYVLCFLSTCLDVCLQNAHLSVYVFLCLLHICLYVCVFVECMFCGVFPCEWVYVYVSLFVEHALA